MKKPNADIDNPSDRTVETQGKSSMGLFKYGRALVAASYYGHKAAQYRRFRDQYNSEGEYELADDAGRLARESMNRRQKWSAQIGKRSVEL